MSLLFGPRWPQPDFLAARRKPSWAPRLFAGVGAGVLALVAGAAWMGHRDIDRVADRLSFAASRTKALERHDPMRAASPGTPEARLAAWNVVAALRHPWDDVLDGIDQSTPDGLQWLTLDSDASSGEIRLEGEASDVSTALRLVDRLSARRGWRDVELTRWQRAQAAPQSGAALRFAIDAHIERPDVVTDLARAP